MNRKVYIISGPSGVGKSTVIKSFLNRYPKGELIKSATTRMSRGEDDYYYHITKEQIESYPGGFIETNIYNGNFYGTPYNDIICAWESDKIPFLDIDINGLKQIKKKEKDIDATIISIFLLADAHSIYQRLVKRNTDSMETIKKRMKIALSEIEEIDNYDVVIFNDDVDETVDNIMEIVNGNGTNVDRHRVEKVKQELRQICSNME